MYGWANIDEKKFKRKNHHGYRLWRLIQLINYGLDGEKLDRGEVKNAWNEIAEHLDPYKKRYLENLLWGKQYLLPNNLNFWNLSQITQG